MDKRSTERAKQHGPHGWKPDTLADRNVDTIGRVLMRCPCGWLGWVFLPGRGKSQD